MLKIENLSVDYFRGKHTIHAVRNVCLDLYEGEMLGIVGESGCGKSTLAMTPLRLLPENASDIAGGKIWFENQELLGLSDQEMRELRGGRIAMVFQDPFTTLNPVLTIGDQIEEVVRVHSKGQRHGASAQPAKDLVIDVLEKVHLPDPERIYKSYPHQISGGQRQRACIAMAIVSNPKIVIADEPTTALDVTVQKEILNLLDQLRKDLNMTVLLITHNMGLLSERTDRLAVMYAGEIVEYGETRSVLRKPLHPYTKGLLQSLPKLAQQTEDQGPVTKSRRLPILPGQPPDLKDLPKGCSFHPRCSHVMDVCREQAPVLKPVENIETACHLY